MEERNLKNGLEHQNPSSINDKMAGRDVTNNYQNPSLDIDIATRLDYHTLPKKQYLYESRDVVPIHPALPITDDTETISFDVQPCSEFIDLREVNKQINKQ